LLLAAFVATSTLLFFGYASGANLSPKRFWLINTLWYACTLIVGMVFVCWFASEVIRTGETISRLLVLIFLGLLGPIYSAFGLVAYALPTRWQHFIAGRDAAQQYYRRRRGLVHRSKV
jgi:hypothetical protein